MLASNWKYLRWIRPYPFSLYAPALFFCVGELIIRLVSFLVLQWLRQDAGLGLSCSHPGGKDASYNLQTKVLSFLVIGLLLNNDRGQDYSNLCRAMRANPKTKGWGQYYQKYIDARKWVMFYQRKVRTLRGEEEIHTEWKQIFTPLYTSMALYFDWY